MKAVLLGSGLSTFVSHFDVQSVDAYAQFSNLEIIDLEGHERKVYLAKWKDTSFVILSGRLHFYEGFDQIQLSNALELIIKKYDISDLCLTSISGAFNPEIELGRWSAVNSILSFPSTENLPLSFGEPHIHSCEMMGALPQSTYAFQQGPSLGTPAEYKMLHAMGADLVGMSMWNEYLFCKSQTLHFSMLSYPVCQYFPFVNIKEPDHQEVVALAEKGAVQLADFYKEYLKSAE